MLGRLLSLGVGYLLGGILTGEIAARLLTGRSARQIGTGNPGTANLLTHVGKGAGAAVLAGDVAKTALACYICHRAFADTLDSAAMLYAGFGAVLGHDFPLWMRGHGGKGVAVTCTWLILYLPVTGALCCVAGGAAVLRWGYLPVGAALIALLAVPIGAICYGAESCAVLLLAAAIMLYRHAPGLRRVFRGEEPRFFR